jgi:hypothetical protein
MDYSLTIAWGREAITAMQSLDGELDQVQRLTGTSDYVAFSLSDGDRHGFLCSSLDIKLFF